ncbi:peptide deformylase [Estrella lausannensis]|uniref:Peptide deformylase n=1 Tax=Estrella lausannensis TaxID=483423 RepID=A0A0H5DNW6_9BACT|nr:peptide deformylase [Estrella lausannensis]CRX38101.1 hypothetical protein ELAC_0749 [Estrella lausannensis]
MRLKITYYGNPLLRKKAQPVGSLTPEVKQLAQDMVETMFLENGIGLAANQVGSLLRIFVTAVPKKDDEGRLQPGQVKVYINPEIIEFSDDKVVYNEGCLSIPGLRGEVSRPFRVKIRALDIDGNAFEEELEGLDSVCVCHENDHLNGVLFIDRIKGKERDEMEKKLKQIKKDYHLGQ